MEPNNTSKLLLLIECEGHAGQDNMCFHNRLRMVIYDSMHGIDMCIHNTPHIIQKNQIKIHVGSTTLSK